MARKEPAFTIGVEEEYLLVDKETRSLVVEPPATLMQEAEEKCGPQVASELLQSQIEIGTKVCNNVQEAQEDLARLRRNIMPVVMTSRRSRHRRIRFRAGPSKSTRARNAMTP